MAGAGRVSLSFWTHLRAALWQELMISMINGSLNESLAHEAECAVSLERKGGETEVGEGCSQQPSCQAPFLLLGSFLPSFTSASVEFLLCAGPCSGSETPGMELHGPCSPVDRRSNPV